MALRPWYRHRRYRPDSFLSRGIKLDTLQTCIRRKIPFEKIPRYPKDLPKIPERYRKDTQKILQRSSKDPPKIFQDTPKIPKRYRKDTQKIPKRYQKDTKTIPGVSENPSTPGYHFLECFHKNPKSHQKLQIGRLGAKNGTPRPPCPL